MVVVVAVQASLVALAFALLQAQAQVKPQPTFLIAGPPVTRETLLNQKDKKPEELKKWAEGQGWTWVEMDGFLLIFDPLVVGIGKAEFETAFLDWLAGPDEQRAIGPTGSRDPVGSYLRSQVGLLEQVEAGDLPAGLKLQKLTCIRVKSSRGYSISSGRTDDARVQRMQMEPQTYKASPQQGEAKRERGSLQAEFPQTERREAGMGFANQLGVAKARKAAAEEILRRLTEALDRRALAFGKARSSWSDAMHRAVEEARGGPKRLGDFSPGVQRLLKMTMELESDPRADEVVIQRVDYMIGASYFGGPEGRPAGRLDFFAFFGD